MKFHIGSQAPKVPQNMYVYNSSFTEEIFNIKIEKNFHNLKCP